MPTWASRRTSRTKTKSIPSVEQQEGWQHTQLVQPFDDTNQPHTPDKPKRVQHAPPRNRRADHPGLWLSVSRQARPKAWRTRAVIRVLGPESFGEESLFLRDHWRRKHGEQTRDQHWEEHGLGGQREPNETEHAKEVERVARQRVWTDGDQRAVFVSRDVDRAPEPTDRGHTD